MAKAPKTWAGTLKNVDAMCNNMMNDTGLKNLLPSDRYFLLKYEDLLVTPVSTLVNLFTNLKLEFDITAADALYNHTRKIAGNVQKMKQYYSTYRTADNDIYKWKKELKYSNITFIEEKCKEFLKYAGYPNYKTMERDKKFDLTVPV